MAGALALDDVGTGNAEDGNGDDVARQLTAGGERQARAAGQALAALGAGLDACLTSPKARAAELGRPLPELRRQLRAPTRQA